MLYETCAPVLDEVADVLQVDIWRLGAVCERFCLDNEPGMTIARFFCRDQWTENDGPLSGSENFELHAHEIRDLSGTKVNSWMRCKSGRVSGLTDGPAIILQQDVNTLADDKSRTYTRSQRSEFFRAAVQEIDRLYALCFPGTERQ